MAGSETYNGNGQTAVIADPENITRDECLALAQCGATPWNTWRNKHPSTGGWSAPYKNIADFSGRDFTGEFVDFQEFSFGHGADFTDTKFYQVVFNSAEFGRDARFTGAQFESWASFEGARFGPDAGFNRCRFGALTTFEVCQLDSRATFLGATFDETLNMRGVVFGDETSFDWASFGHGASFVGALFVGNASFIAATIGFGADFSGLMVGGSLSFEATIFEGQTSFQALSWGALNHESRASSFLEELAKDRQASPWVFKAISFQGARFEGSVDFSDRHFEGVTEFSKTRFEIDVPFLMEDCLPSRVCKELIPSEGGRMRLPSGRHVEFAMVPEFFQCKLHQNSSFEGAVFPTAQGTEDAARAYRVLKQAFSAQQATREEQRFFRLEMAEEALMARPLWTMLSTWWARPKQGPQVEIPPPRFLYRLYARISNFGFSIARPLGLFFASLLVAAGFYALQADLTACWLPGVPCTTTGPLIQFTVAHALPGFEKLAEPASNALFGKNLGVWTVLTVVLHKAVSLLALFLIGLALRNLFKMK